MTDLTEQWKKGELPVDKDYYIKLKCGFILIDYYCQLYDNCHFPIDIGFDSIPEDDITEVLAPVPSYEELQNMNKAVNECMAANIKLVEKMKALNGNMDSVMQTNQALCKKLAELKELLKECKEPLEVFADKKDACEWCPEDLLTKIDEALK